MKLTRLAYTQHPRPPQRELRQRGVFSGGGSSVMWRTSMWMMTGPFELWMLL